jgi:hypothetical protein
MEATVPLNGKLARQALDGVGPWSPAARVLAGMVPVVLEQSSIGYDPLLGVLDLRDF